jgi:hypothetical protein
MIPINFLAASKLQAAIECMPRTCADDHNDRYSAGKGEIEMADTSLERALIDAAIALIAYAGPLDDPSVGWIGRNPSHPDLFQCERCGQENLDCTKIDHLPGCSAKALLDALSVVREKSK